MIRTIRARVRGGMLTPLEPLNLPDGSEVDVTVETELSKAAGAEVIRATSGAWADLLDCEEFERPVYTRRHHHRAPVRL